MSKKQLYANDVYLGLTEPVRVLFPPRLAEPQKIDGKGDPKYEVQIGFPADHPDFMEHKKIVAKLAREKFGDVKISMGPDSDIDIKFKDGDAEYEAIANHPDPDKQRDYPFLKGLVIMKLRSKQPVGVFDTRRRDSRGIPIKITDKDEIRSTIYSGCYVSLKLTYATYDAPSRTLKPGVTAYPEQICFVRDGERLGGSAKDDGSGFASVQGEITDFDPTGEDEAEPAF